MKIFFVFIAFIILNTIAYAHGISEADKLAMIDGGNLRYIWLGATHMLSGYDHLLFLFGVVFFLTPVIFITSMKTSKDVLKGFELGANDYLKKPFEMIELKARIDNIKRQFKIDASETIEIFSNIFYDFSRYMLRIDGKEIKLSKKEGAFLVYLLQHRGDVLSVDTLMINVWSPDASLTDSTIRTYIKRLRNILGKSSITIVWGIGYIFVDKIETK